MAKASSAKGRNVLLNLRVSDRERAAWQAEAKRRDVPLSQLIRHVMNELCGVSKPRGKTP